ACDLSSGDEEVGDETGEGRQGGGDARERERILEASGAAETTSGEVQDGGSEDPAEHQDRHVEERGPEVVAIVRDAEKRRPRNAVEAGQEDADEGVGEAHRQHRLPGNAQAARVPEKAREEAAGRRRYGSRYRRHAPSAP